MSHDVCPVVRVDGLVDGLRAGLGLLADCSSSLPRGLPGVLLPLLFRGLPGLPGHFPLCLSCRRPASNLCPTCKGAYFCDDTCRRKAWAHDQVLCPSWKKYAGRRAELSEFSFLSFTGTLTARPFQTSMEPYKEFLRERGRLGKGWWTTEVDGWAGGLSGSAK